MATWHASGGGKPLENRIKVAAGIYAFRRVAALEKVDPPSITYQAKGQPRTQLLENPFPDFVGTWTERGGRALFIEAKTTSEDRLPFWTKEGGFTKKQFDDLTKWERAGAVCAVVWEYRLQWRLVTLPIVRNVAAQSRGKVPRRSVRWEEAIPIPGGESLVMDFMAVIRKVFPLLC